MSAKRLFTIALSLTALTLLPLAATAQEEATEAAPDPYLYTIDAGHSTIGFKVRHFTVSNCLANMVSPDHYGEFLLPCDTRLAEEFGLLGVHNCAWSADHLLDHYTKIPHVAYLDMGIDSDLSGAKRTFPAARRAIVYPPTDVGNKPIEAVRGDVRKIGHEYAPCDLVLADVEDGTPDERIKTIIALCEQLSR